MAESLTRSGLTVTWREDGIIQYHIRDMNRATVDAWFDVSHGHDLEYLESGKHLARMLTLAPGLILTPYAMNAAARLSHYSPPGLQESLAVVVENRLTYTLTAILVDNLQERSVRTSTRIFRTESEGLAWLHNRIAAK